MYCDWTNVSITKWRSSKGELDDSNMYWGIISTVTTIRPPFSHVEARCLQIMFIVYFNTQCKQLKYMCRFVTMDETMVLELTPDQNCCWSNGWNHAERGLVRAIFHGNTKNHCLLNFNKLSLLIFILLQSYTVSRIFSISECFHNL